MPRTAERIISVGGGKGGVGKSVIAANLAVAMAQAGRRVILVDGDLGAANQHTMFGIDRPGPTLHGLFTHQIQKLSDAVVPTSVAGLSLVPGSGAVLGAANINHGQKIKLGNHIRSLDADVVILDVGAGVHFNTLDLFGLADVRVLVTSPQMTAVQNAYAFLKGSVMRTLRQAANGPDELALVEGDLPARETDRVPLLLERVRARAPDFAARLADALRSFRARLLGNLVYEPREEGVFHAVSRMVRDFLGVEAPVLGFLRDSRAIHGSVNRRKPLLADGTPDECAALLRAFAQALLAVRIDGPRAEPHATAESPTDRPPPDDLPANLWAYSRRHDRHAVHWAATLTVGEVLHPVTVREISMGGALLDVSCALSVGAGAQLTFSDLPGAPSVPLTVRYHRNEGRSIGVEFLDAEPPHALAEAISRQPGAQPSPPVAAESLTG